MRFQGISWGCYGHSMEFDRISWGISRDTNELEGGLRSFMGNQLSTNLKAKINLKTNPFPAQNQKLQTSTHLFASCISSQISLGLCQEASLFQVVLPFAISLCTILCINSFSMFLEIVHLFHSALHFFKMPCHVLLQIQGSTLFKVCPFTCP